MHLRTVKKQGKDENTQEYNLILAEGKQEDPVCIICLTFIFWAYCNPLERSDRVSQNAMVPNTWESNDIYYELHSSLGERIHGN